MTPAEAPPLRRLRAVSTALFLLLCCAGAAAAQAPGVKAKPPRLGWPAAQPLGVSVVPAPSSAQAVTETEPNNSPQTATPIGFPDEVLGVVNPAGDVDWFSLNLTAGTVVDIEVFSERLGSPMDAYIELFAADGQTSIAYSDDAVGLDSQIRVAVPATGRYYLAIVDLFSRGGASYQYRIVLGRAVTGPGDPTTVFASGLGSPWMMAAAPGEIFMVDQEARVIRVGPDGTPSLFLTDIGVPYDVVIDGYGALLVAGFNNQLAGMVTRVDLQTSERSILIGSGLQSASSITVGPDGDLWIADTRARRIYRYDPAGAQRSSLSTSGTHGEYTLDIAFSPSGVLYYSNMVDAIYRVVDGTPQRVIVGRGFGGIAFDAQGNLYVGTVDRGVLLYDANHQLLHEPFALTGLQLVASLAFMRDAAGAMTSRLVGVNLTDGTMREMNPAGMRAPGLRIGVNLLTVTNATVRQAVIGAAYADTLRVLETVAGAVWTLSSGALPRGVTLSPGGVLSGVPEETGRFTFNARVEGSGRSGARTLTMDVVRPVVQLSAAINHLLGMPGQLSADMTRYLDLQGNHNGRYDIGDLKAFRRYLAGQGITTEAVR